MLLINAVNAEGRPVELYVKDGKIAAIGQDLAALAGENETVLDAGGLTVLPAFVDLHCHWRTPGFEYKEDIETGSRAAAAGGYTFVNLMPNTKPVCSSAAQAAMVEQKAAEVGLCDVNQTVSITEDFDGKTIDHLKTLPASVRFRFLARLPPGAGVSTSSPCSTMLRTAELRVCLGRHHSAHICTCVSGAALLYSAYRIQNAVSDRPNCTAAA